MKHTELNLDLFENTQTAKNRMPWEELVETPSFVQFPKEAKLDLKLALQKLNLHEIPFASFQVQALIAFISHTPTHVVQKILNFKNHPAAPGYLVIRGFPTDSELPATPADGKTTLLKQTFISEAINTGVSSLLGEIFGHEQEKAGELIHNVCPVKTSRHQLSNESSEVDFRFHVDNSFFAFRPHYLSLFCLREDRTHQAATTLANIKDALATLSAEDNALLREPLYQIRTPRSFQKSDADERWTEPTSILFGPSKYPEARFSFNGLKATTPEATECLERLEQALRNESVSVKWVSRPGDLILINNRKALHGRTHFKAAYDGNDRWLQRIYSHSDSWLSRECESEKLVFSWSNS